MKVGTWSAPLLFAAVAQAQDPLLWGGFEAGPYAVGFRSSIAIDGSRKYDGKSGRPVLMDVWFPASKTTEAGFAYERYFLVPDVSAHPWFRRRLENFVVTWRVTISFHTKTEAALKLLATRTSAHLDAAPAQGRFPLVLYHSGTGGSFEDNSVLFEYLASHGYVVVSGALALRRYHEARRDGSQRRRADFVSVDRFAEMPCARFRRPRHHDRIQARKLADAQADSRSDEEAHAAACSGPHIRAGAAETRFSAFEDYLQHSPHYDAAAAELSHDDLLTHGYLGRVLMREPNAEAFRRSYEEVCRTVLTFLDASLKGDAEASRSLNQHIATSPVSIHYQPAR